MLSRKDMNTFKTFPVQSSYVQFWKKTGVCVCVYIYKYDTLFYMIKKYLIKLLLWYFTRFLVI